MWIVQGVKTTADGRSIYEGPEPVFFDPGQADYYRDETAMDAAREKVAWVRRHAEAGARLLDVGANFGLFVREAAGHFDATGIEPSPTVVELARREHGARLQTGSIYDADTAPGPFDVVTLFDVLEHLPDPNGALEQCRRRLRPGGLLFLTTPDTGSLAARLLGRHWHYIDLDEHVALFDRRNLTTVLGRNGFERLEVRTVSRGYRFSYIRRRLAFLGRHAPLLRLAHAATWPLTLYPAGRVQINLADVMGVVARRTDQPMELARPGALSASEPLADHEVRSIQVRHQKTAQVIPEHAQRHQLDPPEQPQQPP
jgi:SAM-dependent methyltransferase